MVVVVARARMCVCLRMSSYRSILAKRVVSRLPHSP